MPRAATVKESFPIIRYHPRLALAMGYLTVLIVRRDLHAIIALLSLSFLPLVFNPLCSLYLRCEVFRRDLVLAWFSIGSASMLRGSDRPRPPAFSNEVLFCEFFSIRLCLLLALSSSLATTAVLLFPFITSSNVSKQATLTKMQH